jgi:hypothetical protein
MKYRAFYFSSLGIAKPGDELTVDGRKGLLP